MTKICTYTITSVSGNRYVGSTTNYKRRTATHKRELLAGVHKNVPLTRAAARYGIDALKFEVLDDLDGICAELNLDHAQSTTLARFIEQIRLDNEPSSGYNMSATTTGGSTCRPVVCVETGVTFPSITSAAEWAGVTYSSLRDAVVGRSATCAGYNWQDA